MKTKLFALLFVVLLPTLLFAYNPYEYEHAKIGDLYYSIDVDTKTAKVTSETNHYNPYNNYSSLTSTLDIPQTVIFYGKIYTVTSIDSCAFYWCNRLTRITLPNTITSIGDRAFYQCTNLRSITIPEGVTSIGNYAFDNCSSLTSITLPNTITSIGNYAFWGCDDLSSITIPKGVTSIGDYTFAACSKLSSISIPKGVTSIGNYAFNGCSRLKSITLPNTITIIGDYAFYDCDGLSSITIPESVTSIGSYTFKGCWGIKSILYNAIHINSTISHVFDDCESASFVFGDKVEYIPCLGSLRMDAIIIPESVIHIEENAFSTCKCIESVVWNAINCLDKPSFNSAIISLTFGDKVEYIPYLGSMSLLSSITIPESVIHIEEDAFRGCRGVDSIIWNARNFKTNRTYSAHPFYSIRSSVKHFSFGNNIDTIPEEFCKDMTNMTSVSISKNVKSIRGWTFHGCKSLHSVYYEGTLKDWCNIDFESVSSNPCYYAGALFYINKQLEKNPVIPNTIQILKPYVFAGAWLESVTLPESLTSIGSGAFMGCSNLTSITIPESVTHIEYYAFSDCSSLTSITIPESVTRIGAEAFYGCSSLTSITLPESLTSIGGRAFCGCTGLTSITIPNNVMTIGEEAFRRCSGLTSVKLPANLIAIENGIFSGCTNLSAIIIPDKVTTIGGEAFSNCSRLTSITIPENVTKIGGNGYCAFSGCSSLCSITWNASNYKEDSYSSPFYAIREQIKEFTFGSSTIPAFICSGMSKLTSITITKGVETTSKYAFDKCTNLHKINYNATDCPNISSPEASPFYDIRKQISTFNIGSECTAIPSYIGYGMSITDITIPKGIKSIGNGAFAACSNLRNIYYYAQDCSISTPYFMSPFEPHIYTYKVVNFCFGNEVTTIPAYLCANMRSLEKVTLPENLTSIGASAFRDCYHLEQISFPNCITDIGEYAFAGCSKLVSVNNFSNTNLTMIEKGVFMNCSSLIVSYIPNGVKSIKDYAFYDIRGGVPHFPESVTNIGNYAFAEIGEMFCISVDALIPPQITSTTFKGVYCTDVMGRITKKNEIPAYVPKDALADYQADPYWSEFKLLARGGSAVEDVSVIEGVTLRGNVLSINGYTDESMCLYTINGTQLYAGQVRDITLPNAGVYLVQIGNAVQKLIVP